MAELRYPKRPVSKGTDHFTPEGGFDLNCILKFISTLDLIHKNYCCFGEDKITLKENDMYNNSRNLEPINCINQENKIIKM